MKNNIFLKQPRRGYTREAQLTPYKAGGRSVGMITVILLVLSVLVTACNKPEMHNLEGTWQWTRTSGGIAGVNYTPESEGFEAEIVFKGNQFTFYKDGEKIISSTYRIDDDVDQSMYTNKGGKDEPIYSWFHIRFNLTDAQYKKILEATDGKIQLYAYKFLGTLGYSEAEGQVLTISDNMADGFIYSFVKKQ